MNGQLSMIIFVNQRVSLDRAKRFGAALRLLWRAAAHPQLVVQRANAQIQLRKAGTVPWNVRLRGKVSIEGSGKVYVGQNIMLVANLMATELNTRKHGIIRLGARTFINYGASISATQSVTIGEDCHIGHYAFIYDSDLHGIEDKNQVPAPAPVTIGDRVWLGTRVTVLKGVTIGDDAVIGAGSVVTKDIPPRSVAVGLPARVVRTF